MDCNQTSPSNFKLNTAVKNILESIQFSSSWLVISKHHTGFYIRGYVYITDTGTL